MTTPDPCETAFMARKMVALTEAETAALIRQSSPSQPLMAHFGGNQMVLKPHASGRWAYVALDQMRATNSTGSS